MAKLFLRFNLQFTFIKNIYNVYLFIYSFYILKFLTAFRKTVETGVDPRLERNVSASFVPRVSLWW